MRFARTVPVIFLLSLFPAVWLPSVSAQSAFDVFEADISAIQTALETSEVTSLQLVDQYLQRVEAYDKQGPKLNSIVRINPRAREIAVALDAERLSSGARSLLHGIPIVIKDNYNTDDMPTTGGSVALADFVPSENATQVDKLIAAGAIILAKTNLHEYAYGITSVSSILGQTRNPYDPRRVPGGSSGGTGAAVAASFAAAGFGSDTCGSIRIPSAYNNLIGLRPSKGLSSIYGIMPLSHTQDVAGPLARGAEDLAIILDLVVGFDARDEATQIMRTSAAPEFHENLNGATLQSLRIGKLQSYFDDADSAVRVAIDNALEWYQQQGVEIVEVEIPELRTLIGRSGLIGHEFAVDLDQYLATFASTEIENLADIVDLGLFHEAVEGALSRSRSSQFNQDSYSAAVAARADLRLAIEQVFEDNELDAIVYPPIAQTQVFVGESQPGNNCSISANSGLPAISMPAGFTENGLPVGMELLGEFLHDANLLSIAYKYEQAMDTRQAPSTTPALQAGAAPAPRIVELVFEQQGVALSFQFEFDQPSNELRYQVATTGASSISAEAVVLLIDREMGGALNDPVVLNLMGPDTKEAAGSYFMSPQFRQAFLDQRVYLKVFADPFARSGAIQLVQ